ncbi:hypothetical protein J6590_048609 [Homalodisca vitripennis]|nr:hypothetical protein J6590_048609 [Homalodisca vitripennis]
MALRGKIKLSKFLWRYKCSHFRSLRHLKQVLTSPNLNPPLLPSSSLWRHFVCHSPINTRSTD